MYKENIVAYSKQVASYHLSYIVRKSFVTSSTPCTQIVSKYHNIALHAFLNIKIYRNKTRKF